MVRVSGGFHLYRRDSKPAMVEESPSQYYDAANGQLSSMSSQASTAFSDVSEVNPALCRVKQPCQGVQAIKNCDVLILASFRFLSNFSDLVSKRH